MTALDEFLAAALPALRHADTALQNGDAAARLDLWSDKEPVTVFGAVNTWVGWDQVSRGFAQLGPRFSSCSAFDYEVVAAGVSGDLGYIAGIEHTTASVDEAEPAAYQLRVTTIFRREDGRWRPAHRHADALPASGPTREQVQRLAQEPTSDR